MLTQMRATAVPLFFALSLAACGGDNEGATPGEMAAGDAPAGTVTLTGAGATFPYPIYSRWFSEYSDANPVRVNYQSIGSGGGIRQLTEGTVDFGASDAPMTEEELAAAPGTFHLPTVVGAVAVTYNLPSVDQPIRLTGDVLGEVFQGNITRWNDSRIQALNPGVNFPDRDILVVHRSDGSGTTYVFTEYLSDVSPAWQQEVGTGKSVDWPVGLGGKGNEGVARSDKTDRGRDRVYRAGVRSTEQPSNGGDGEPLRQLHTALAGSHQRGGGWGGRSGRSGFGPAHLDREPRRRAGVPDLLLDVPAGAAAVRELRQGPGAS